MMKETNKVDVKNIYTIVIKHDTAKANVKVACRVHIWKKSFSQNSEKFGYSFITDPIIYMFLPYIF